MSLLKLNETPVRTSKNFKINNIKIEDIVLPESLSKFNGLQVSGDYTLAEDINISNMKYGLGDSIEKYLIDNSNSRIRVSGSKAKLVFTFDDNNCFLNNYIEIVAEGDMDVVIEYISATNNYCFSNSFIKLFAKANANINISVINLLNESSNFFVTVENELDENANVDYTIIDLGAKNSIQNYYSNIVGAYAINNLKSVYLGKENQVKDINYIAELCGEKTKIDIDVQGALNDCAKKNFKGTIDFKKGCKKAKGDEKEYCMLLSDKAKSIALPMLLCTEDDVEGNHSTASGKLDDKEIFYIMTRGLDKKEATKLIVKAKLNSIIEKIKDVETKNKINYEIDRRLD